MRNGLAPILFAVCVVLCALASNMSAEPGTATVGRMLQQLNDEDWVLRAEAISFLGDNRVASALEPCEGILVDEEIHPWVRGRALVAVARIKGAESLEQVKGFVTKQEPALRAAAADALDVIGGEKTDDSIGVLLKDKEPLVRYHALVAHAHRHGEKVWPDADSMTQSVDRAFYEPAARALAYVGNEEALNRVVKLAGQMRARVIRGLNGVANPKVIPVQLHMLRSVSVDSSEFAVILTNLQKHKRAELVAAMETELKSGDHKRARAVAMVVTRLVREPKLGDALRAAMVNVKDTRTISAGMVALGQRPMEPDRHKALFEEHLDHKDSYVRALAIRCLAHCESVNQFTLLEDRVTDKSEEVVFAALGSLLAAPKEQAPRGRMVAYLQEPLQSDNEEVRAMAFKLLGHAGGEDDFQPAMALLTEKLRGTDEVQRLTAAKALGQIAPEEGVPHVVRTQGYVANWMVIGTFLNDEKNSGFNIEYPPEKEIDFEKKYMAKYVWALGGRRREGKNDIEREVEWNEATVDQTNGKLLMAPVVPPPGGLCVAYAVADFNIDQEREVVLNIDGDDAFRVWFNGEKIAESAGTFAHRKPVIAASFGNKITLKAGMNRFVVKSTNIDYEWWVRLRLTDGDGRPVEVIGVVREK